MKDRELPLTLKSWARNLLSLWHSFLDLKIIPSPQFFWQMGDEQLFSELELAREMVKSVVPNPVVYYPGIGNIGKAGIDLIYPLAATDFSRLVAVDTGPYGYDPHSYERFVQAVTLNLALVSAVDQEKIDFQKINDNEFKAFFSFEERLRELHFFANFDATLKYPQTLENGFQVFFTRKTNSLFRHNTQNSIPESLHDGFMNFLAKNGLGIFQEIVGFNEGGF